jgi:N-acetylglucosaminyldiphosphoundecaprenol N-acetyl-beta-D-mannosaminyltransferase
MSGNGFAPRVDVLGVGISVVDIERARGIVEGWIESRERHYVCVTPVAGVMASQRDDAVRRIHNESGLTVPDGMPMVWAGRYAGAPSIDRVYGPTFMRVLCERAAQRGWRCFFYGGKAGTAQLLEERMCAEFPGLLSAGTYTPPFRELTPEEDAEVISLIDASEADIVWVGLSTPKQERWMAAHIDRLQKPCVMLGVGAAFDVNSGLRRDAPRWVGRVGLHWLFRLIQEPRRLWRRYLFDNPAFVAAVLRNPPRLREQ